LEFEFYSRFRLKLVAIAIAKIARGTTGLKLLKLAAAFRAKPNFSKVSLTSFTMIFTIPTKLRLTLRADIFTH
jgi:hypothetical protein